VALTSVLVQTLLHEDRPVRVAAASLAFNVGAWVQKGRVARIKREEVVGGIRADEEDGEREVVLVSAVAEALSGEEESDLLVAVRDRSITDGAKELMMLTERTFLSFSDFHSVHRLTATLGIFDSAVAFL
jgi:PUL domain